MILPAFRVPSGMEERHGQPQEGCTKPRGVALQKVGDSMESTNEVTKEEEKCEKEEGR